jgi:hypothetical protein
MSRFRLGDLMGKKKNHDNNGDGDDLAPSGAEAALTDVRPEPVAAQQRKSLMPALSVGDILALVILTVLSAALLLEGYYSGFRDYSKEIIALFAVVVGFLLGRKT